jgi:hypothetical protein
MDLFIRTIGIARATMKIGLADLVYNIKRSLFQRRTGGMGAKIRPQGEAAPDRVVTRGQNRSSGPGNRPADRIKTLVEVSSLLSLPFKGCPHNSAAAADTFDHPLKVLLLKLILSLFFFPFG